MGDDARWTPVLKAAWATHGGLVREHNEDLGCVVRLREAGLIGMAVLDGMGGHGGGDVASRIAVRALRRAWRRPVPDDRQARYEWLLESLYAADEAIRRHGSRALGLGSMGATVAIALATPRECLFMHAGDCRVYHFRNGVRQFVTADHSIVRILLETGTITEDQVATHPMRSTVTSCLGGGTEARLSVDPKWEEGGGPAFRTLQPGDTVLLCSDGLWSEVAAERIAELVAENRGKPRRLVHACIAAALEGGAHDNVTVAALSVVRRGANPPGGHRTDG
jgi:protein phosphatase